MNKKERWIHGISIGGIVIIFAMLWAFKGTGTCPDTASYEKMTTMREPLYPLFLWIFRTLFGSSCYIHIVAFFQMVLSIFAVVHFAVKIAGQYEIHGWYLVILYLILLSFFVLPAFFSANDRVSFAVIFSEGVTYPLFLLYAEHLLLSASKLSLKECNISMVYAGVIAFARSGLLPTILVAMLVRIYILFHRADLPRGIIKTVLITAGAFLILNIAERTYFFVLTEQAMTHTYGAVTTMSNVVYASEPEDAYLFEDEQIRQIFEDMYAIAESEGWVHTAEEENGLLQKALSISEAHDPIKFQAFSASVQEFLENESNEVDRNRVQDAVARNITMTLLPDNFETWFVDYIALCLLGFIDSIAARPLSLFMQMYALFAYMLAFGGIIYFRKNKRVAVCMCVVLLSILSNVCAVSLVIMPISRYMLYNFPLFYTAFLIMWCNRDKVNGEKDGMEQIR